MCTHLTGRPVLGSCHRYEVVASILLHGLYQLAVRSYVTITESGGSECVDVGVIRGPTSEIVRKGGRGACGGSRFSASLLFRKQRMHRFGTFDRVCPQLIISLEVGFALGSGSARVPMRSGLPNLCIRDAGLRCSWGTWCAI